MKEEVVLVDREDKEIGLMEKMEAHEKGLLHRAFSVFLFNSKGETLLQRRAASKYHSPGLWTNTCCSHPRKGEGLSAASLRKLDQELGIAADVQEIGSFIYKAEFDNGLTEHELDHVLVGWFDGESTPNPEEVDMVKWMSIEEVIDDTKANPDNYTAWFKIILDEFGDRLKVFVRDNR